VIVTSAVTGLGLKALSAELLRRVPSSPEPPASLADLPEDLPEHRTYRPARPGYEVRRLTDHSFEVRGEQVDRLMNRYDLDNDEALAYLEGRLRAIGVIGALQAQGFEPGDEVVISGVAFDLDPDT
jgi:GTP-binding protein